VRAAIGVVVDHHDWLTAVPGAAALCRRAARAALAKGCSAEHAVELCIVLADDAMIADLNGRFRGRREPTNVLSFPARGPSAPAADEPGRSATMLGDVVVALETLRREAERDGKRLEHHLAHLVVHGVLHLVGHDHANDAEASRMEALEIAALDRLSVGNPYE
jgi:probable rRNA maturation factor